MIMAFCALLAAILFSPSYASAQNFTLQGSVKTEKGEPVPGATIILSGTQQGVTTDAQGNFLLRLAKKPAADASLVVSYLGYKAQTIPVGNRTSFDIVLQEESTSMDEVVVVGYGTMRKKDLTGSLSSIGGEAILNRQSPTISQALQGAMPGVTVTRTNSAPGGSATIRIRGITSMTEGASDPYVLIDGVAGSIDDVNPNDIENITVLKDAASASIYGSQAAAGVILITTKRAGKSGASVTYNYTLGLDFQSQKPEYMNANDYMAAVNELRYNDLPSGGWFQDYSREYVENYAILNRENPDIYPNVNWMDLVLKDVGVRHSHSLTIQSGGDKRSSVLSLGFDDVDGLFRKNLSWKRYTARLNNDIQVFKWMKASADISLRYTDQVNPHASPSGTMRYIPPIYQAVWSDGRYAPGKDGVNPYAALMSGGEKDTDKYLANAKFQLDITPVKGLTVTGIFSPQFTYTKIKDFQRQTSYFSYQEESLTSSKYISSALTTELEESRGDTFAHTTQVYANYQHTFGQDHNFSAMVGYENYWYQEGTIVAKNTSFSHSLIPDLAAGNSDGVTANSKDINELARRSYFARLQVEILRPGQRPPRRLLTLRARLPLGYVPLGLGRLGLHRGEIHGGRPQGPRPRQAAPLLRRTGQRAYQGLLPLPGRAGQQPHDGLHRFDPDGSVGLCAGRRHRYGHHLGDHFDHRRGRRPLDAPQPPVGDRRLVLQKDARHAPAGPHRPDHGTFGPL